MVSIIYSVWHHLCNISSKIEKMKKLTILLIVLVALITISFSATTGKRHHRSIDSPVMIEDWMTKPFNDSVEEPLLVEDWMTKPFITLS
jgi:hypothetical protein